MFILKVWHALTLKRDPVTPRLQLFTPPLRTGPNPLAINALESNIIINALRPTLRQSAFVVLSPPPALLLLCKPHAPRILTHPLNLLWPHASTLVLYMCVSYCFYDLPNTNDPVLLENGKQSGSRTKGLFGENRKTDDGVTFALQTKSYIACSDSARSEGIKKEQINLKGRGKIR